MRILAIETVETSGSVAALERDGLLAEQSLEVGRRSAQTLAPGIAGLFARVGWRPSDVQLVAVADGPGSFTGLRIGVTTAKTFAYAVGCEVIGVHALAAIAARVARDVPRFWVVLDAQRSELFAADFSRTSGGQLVGQDDTRIVPADEWLTSLTRGSVVTGPGLQRLLPRLPDGVVVVDRARWAPTAAAVGAVGWESYSAGQRTNVFDLVPRYIRRAAAVERQLGNPLA